jgi:hypothetical protein
MDLICVFDLASKFEGPDFGLTGCSQDVIGQYVTGLDPTQTKGILEALLSLCLN